MFRPEQAAGIQVLLGAPWDSPERRASEGEFEQRQRTFLHYKTTTLTLAQVDAIPEPQTWALMLIGFASVGMALQRHRRSGRVLAA